MKAYRKQVRDGILPPILLWWVSGLDCYLLLDGHDRLAACLAEVVEPPLMTLTAVVDSDEVGRRNAWSVRRHVETVTHIECEISKGAPGAADALVAEQRRFADELVAPQVGAKPTRAWCSPAGYLHGIAWQPWPIPCGWKIIVDRGGRLVEPSSVTRDQR